MSRGRIVPTRGSLRQCIAVRSWWVLVLCLSTPSVGRAQVGGAIAGIVAGYATTDLIFDPDAETQEVGGVVVGAFVVSQTPLAWLSILAEGAYTQRGGDVMGVVQGLPVNGGIRSDYASIVVQARAAVGVGPVRIHVAAGPVVDQLLRNRMDNALDQILDSESPMVFGVSIGFGVGAWVSERIFAEVEARIVEGVGDAFSGDFISVRNRSSELVARVGVPIR